MKSRILRGALALVLVALAVAAWRGSRPAADGPAGAAPAASAPRAPQAVTLHRVQRRDVPVVVEAPATVVPLRTVELRPQVASTVRQIAFREGDEVRRGQPLFLLDDRSEQAALDKARATVLRDRATLAELERQGLRARELRAQNFVAQSAVDSLQSQADAQRALLAADEAALAAAQVALGQTRLNAPMDGRTGAVPVHEGSLVQPSGAALVTLHQMDPIGVAFTVPEAQLAALLRGGESGQGAQGAAVDVLLPASGPGRQAPREGLSGTVRFIDHAVDTASGTLRVKAAVDNPRRQLWPGQTVAVRLTLRTLRDMAVLPQAALILRGAERQVYVVDGQGVAQLRTVQVRHASGDLVAVEGVEAGEKVVLEGRQNLRPGAAVREAAPAGAARGPGRGASAPSDAASRAAEAAR